MLQFPLSNLVYSDTRCKYTGFAVVVKTSEWRLVELWRHWRLFESWDCGHCGDCRSVRFQVIWNEFLRRRVKGVHAQWLFFMFLLNAWWFCLSQLCRYLFSSVVSSVVSLLSLNSFVFLVERFCGMVFYICE
jgi:hypothetical protein